MFDDDVGLSPEPIGRHDSRQRAKAGSEYLLQASRTCDVVSCLRQLKMDLESLNRLDLDTCIPPIANYQHVDLYRVKKRWKRLVRWQRCEVRVDRVATVEAARR